MANWKFTDQYGTNYPALANSILALLIFDVPEGESPVTGTTFTAPLNLEATGKTLMILDAITGLSSIPMSGTVSTENDTLTVSLQSSNTEEMTQAMAACIPLIGGDITKKAWISIDNQTAASATVDDDPVSDAFDMNITIGVGKGSGTLVSQIPMSAGLITLSATFENFGIQLSDLDFLAGGSGFSDYFPDTLPASYYNPGATALDLLRISLSLHIDTSKGLSVSVSTVSAAIGIVNIPLKPNALFLSPLAVWVSLTDPTSSPTVSWGLEGMVNLYPYGKQTNPPGVPPDFSFDFEMVMPTPANPSFALSGNFDNPDQLPVSTLVSDLMNDGSFNTGIGTNITIEKFDFETDVDTQSGTISYFSLEVAMSSGLGLFATPEFGIKDFSLSLTYES